MEQQVLPLSFSGHAAHLTIVPDADQGYQVTLTVDGRDIARDDCDDWRQVERLRARFQQWLQLPGAHAAAQYQQPAA